MSVTPVPTFATLGEMLKYLRRRAGLTQLELSTAVGYSEGQISRLEQNKRMVDSATLLALFVPAFGLEGQPATVKQLLALAEGVQRAKEGEAMRAKSVQAPHRPMKHPLHNLPLRLTSFIGRQDAITTLQQLVPTTRLVTLTGVGGVGKSSLSAAAGSRLVSSFADGVWWVELAPLTGAHLIRPAIASVFALSEAHAHSQPKELAAYLQDRHLLLILDNCEHLIDGCAEMVEQLLRSCPHLHILATSREPLRVDGEVEMQVLPLSIPKGDSGATIVSMADARHRYEAVRLFVERAQMRQPTLIWDDQMAASVVALCVQLDGIPLAIELAASRLKGMTVNELSTRLGERFRLLTDGTRTALPRHQTLRAAVDWSYELLSEAERTLLCRLSVFSGGWTIDAVEVIAEGHLDLVAPIHDPLNPLFQLVNKSLVVAEAHGLETRYRLLETIRHYAAEKLQAAGQIEPIRERHYHHYLALAEQSGDLTLEGQRLRLWLEQVAAELDNLRAAFVWSQEQADGGERGLRLACAMWLFWTCRGRFVEGQRWLENALAHGMAAPSHLRATALWNLADLITFSAPLERTRALAEESLALCQQVEDHQGMAFCYLLIARMAAKQTDSSHALAYALECFERALTLFRAVKWPLMVGVSLINLAGFRLQLGQKAEAAALYEEYLAIMRRPEGQVLVEYALAWDALASLFRIDAVRGKQLFEQELIHQRAQGDDEVLAALLQTYGSALLTTAQPQQLIEAIQLLSEALKLWHRLDIKWSRAGGIARTNLELAYAYLLKGEPAEALVYARKASQLYQGVGDIAGVASASVTLGWAALTQGNLALAAECFHSSLSLSPDASTRWMPEMIVGLAETLRQQGYLVRAGQLFGAATRFGHPLGSTGLAVEALATMKAAHSYRHNPDFDAAWVEGTVMPLAELMALALASTHLIPLA